MQRSSRAAQQNQSCSYEREKYPLDRATGLCTKWSATKTRITIKQRVSSHDVPRSRANYSVMCFCQRICGECAVNRFLTRGGGGGWNFQLVSNIGCPENSRLIVDQRGIHENLTKSRISNFEFSNSRVLQMNFESDALYT